MKLMIVDGNSILNRAYYGVKPLSNHKGVFTNAIYGFFNILLKAIDDTGAEASQSHLTAGKRPSGTRRSQATRQTARACPRSLPCSCR